MWASLQSSRLHSSSRGFTIVELLIVVVVIAILAAITIVSYNGIQNRAYDSSVQADLRNAYNKLLQYRTLQSDESFPDADDTSLEPVGIKVSQKAYDLSAANFIYCYYSRTTPDARIVVIAKSKSGNMFYYSTQAGGKLYTGTNGIGSYAALCDELLPRTGSSGSNARYGYSSGWRSWISV
jgi:prepilin-type N-terminal cleavage/methylation domain-containing protein